MAARDPTKKFTFSVRTRTLFWRRADEKSETPAPPRRVTLGQLPYLPHTAATLSGLSRLDRACLAFLRFVVARRVLACCAIAGLYAMLAGAGVALGCLDLSPNYQYEWVIDAKRNTRNHDMRRAAVAAVDALSSYEEVAPRTDEHLPTWVEYAAAPHVFTSENLQKICEVEARFYGEPSYQKVCVMDEGACAAPAASALTAFYGVDHLQNLARGNASCHLLDEAAVAQTWLHMVAAANASTAGRLAHGMFMAKGAIDTGLSPKTRSLLYVGAPLENFASTTDRTAEQYDTYQEYVEKVETKLMAHFGVSGSVVRSAYLQPWTRDGLEFKAFSYLLQRLEWLRLQEMDSLWMAITICFVALWIRVHTGSLKFAGLGHLTYDGGLQFMWCDTIEALREALFEGFEICFPIAFGVLVLATQNLLVSLYAIVGIALVVASVLGAAESVYGWDLGVIEALAGVMVIGFSVDYAIHLCHMYVEADKSGHSTRMDRFSYAVAKMGGTVVGGAATTLGAAALMLPCQLTFFYKLGLLIFTTIFCSLVFAFGFVMPLLAAAGPSGDWCGFSLPGQKRHHGGRVAAAPLEAAPAP